jgi:uncharacterized protein
MWISRDIERTVADIAATRPAVILTGARQAGKTSLLRKVFPRAQYVSLDLPLLAEEAEESGRQFLGSRATPLIVDEVQHAPKLLRYLKQEIDSRREETGLFFLTGSQKFSLMQGVTESLAGRVAVVELHSLSVAEIERFHGQPADQRRLLEWMLKGGYPELHVRDLDPERFYSDYVATYLERDVRQALQVRSLRDFDRFLRLAATRTGQLLSMNSFAAELGLSPNTVKSWLSVLVASGTVHLLEPFYRNLGKRIVKSPKLYFLDTGLACFLTGIRTVSALQDSALLGAMFETLVLGQMIRRLANAGRRPNLYFYRDHHGNEVDFLIPQGERVRLFESKWSESGRAGTRGFVEVTRLLGEKNIQSRSIVTPVRGSRQSSEPGIRFEDCVDLPDLA